MIGRQFYIDGYRLVQTCNALPEQYDVYDKEERIAYLRVRWGHFSGHLYNPDGTIGRLFYGVPVDGFGNFTPEERDRELAASIATLKIKLASLVTENEDSGL